MTEQAQRTDPMQSVDIIGVVMGSLIHYFPRPIGATCSPVLSRNTYALHVVISPHASIDPGALLIVSNESASSNPNQIVENDGGLFVQRSDWHGKISWNQTPPEKAARVIWIRMP